ncbi:response regulator transcription factor [Anaerosporobacter faecicola]|uniref:response regulator transcription factor n=1 Tax=Anaerosporobacter faecicola TaxID=2718714 RepID=UPI00143CB20A|nr:response regulator transcription factor [Anaerosporobacter faecicola]
MKETILLIEDDIDLSNIMRDFIGNEGYDVRQAYTGSEGLKMVQTCEPALVVLDIMLPEMDGIGVCKKIREEQQIPIIVISAKNSDYDKVLALGVGADDYMTKPFSQIELVARVKSHLRRVTQFIPRQHNSEVGEKSGEKRFGDLRICKESFEVKVKNKQIQLSPKEFQVLDFLSDHPLHVFTKEQIIDQVWGYSDFIDENTIAVYIGRIRDKLIKEGIDMIKTVWGVGYKWEG